MKLLLKVKLMTIRPHALYALKGLFRKYRGGGGGVGRSRGGVGH